MSSINTHLNAIKLDQKKEVFWFNPLAIRNKGNFDVNNEYSQKINDI